MTQDIETGWFDEDIATFGDRLTAAREKIGLSQRELAARLGVRLATLRNWEEDQAMPRGNRLQMLAGMLGVSLTWLIAAQGEGVTAPDDPGTPPLRAALAEVRALRAQFAATSERLAVLESRLATAARDAA